jgi:hypothetical protein
MIDFSTTFRHAILICIPFTIFVAITFWKWPRLWLHSLPKDIVQLAPEKTSRERAITKYILLPLYLLILPGLSVASTVLMLTTSRETFSFVGILRHLYGIWILVHLWDLVVIDGIAMLLIDRHHPPIAGTAGAAGWKNYSFHVYSFMKAVIMSGIFVVPVSAILYWLF